MIDFYFFFQIFFSSWSINYFKYLIYQFNYHQKTLKVISNLFLKQFQFQIQYQHPNVRIFSNLDLQDWKFFKVNHLVLSKMDLFWIQRVIHLFSIFEKNHLIFNLHSNLSFQKVFLFFIRFFLPIQFLFFYYQRILHYFQMIEFVQP